MSKSISGEQRVPARDAEPREQKRGVIERAAYLCFCRRGYHGTSVDDICKAASISKGSFYWYFDGKQTVFHGILDRWVQHVEALLDSGFGTAAKLPDAFAALTKAMEAEMERHRRLLPVWLEYLSQAQRDADVRERLAQMHARIRKAIERFLRQLFASSMTEADYPAFATMIMACFIGLSCDAMVNPREGAITRELERFMSIVAANPIQASAPSLHAARRGSRRKSA